VAVCREVTHRMGLVGEPELMTVTDDAEARRLGFRGSPTVTVNGVDVGDTPEGEPSMTLG